MASEPDNFAEKMNLFLICLGSLFSVINPLGTVPIFMSLTDGKTKHQMISIAVRTSINVLIILLISFFVGSYLLSFFGISLNSLKIAGGLIIASIVAVTLATLLLLLVSRQITKVLGASGMNSLSRIIGFIVTAIGIEFILSAVYSFVYPLTR